MQVDISRGIEDLCGRSTDENLGANDRHAWFYEVVGRLSYSDAMKRSSPLWHLLWPIAAALLIGCSGECINPLPGGNGSFNGNATGAGATGTDTGDSTTADNGGAGGDSGGSTDSGDSGTDGSDTGTVGTSDSTDGTTGTDGGVTTGTTDVGTTGSVDGTDGSTGTVTVTDGSSGSAASTT